MEIFFTWIFLAAVVGFIANNRGKSGLLWFGISLFISPLIGLVLVLVLRGGADEPTLSAEKMARCPFCGEAILAVAIKCKHCQSMIVRPDGDPVANDPCVDSRYFDKPSGMPMGEYRDEILARNGVKVVGSSYEWGGRTYSSFSELTTAIKGTAV